MRAFGQGEAAAEIGSDRTILEPRGIMPSTTSATIAPVSGGGRPEATGGFGLVEVLVAVVVLAVGLLGVAAVAAGVAGLTLDASRETDRALVARQLLDSIRRAGYRSAVSGTAAPVQSGRTWPSSWTVTEESRGVRRVDLRVEADGRTRGLDLSTRLHREPGLPGAGSPR